jgi:hypothetical protein
LDEVEIPKIAQILHEGGNEFELTNRSTGHKIKVCVDLSERERNVVLAGGRLNYIKHKFGQ